MSTIIMTDPETGEQVEREMTPEEQAAHDAMVAGSRKQQTGQQFESSEDTERLRLVQERAADDAAFAALADLSLRGRQAP